MRTTKLLIALFPIIMLVFSCHKDNDDDVLIIECEFSNPIEDLEWLKNLINDEYAQQASGESYITQVNHNNNILFIVDNCCDWCGSVILVYYCNGEYAGYMGSENLPFTLRDEDTIIWTPDNFKCF